ncbi:MAG TPA: hypothetical protein VFI76_01970, partial [Terrimicrobiaceae bacterium]|nr:hypothetical protein [Terrimicrobiaceae bacterium]
MGIQRNEVPRACPSEVLAGQQILDLVSLLVADSEIIQRDVNERCLRVMRVDGDGAENDVV